MGCSSQLQLPPSSGRSYCSLPSAATPASVLRYSDFTTRPAAACKNGKIYRCRRSSRQVKSVLQPAAAQKPEEDEEEFQVLTAIQSSYNHIVILDTPKSRLLLLDSTHNVHSMLNKGSKWTGSYWDEFATLPPVVPDGPIAIFGLGGGTAAHLMLDLWPSLQLEGWEIDEILIDKSRDYLGLCNLEKGNMDGGILNIHIGDVFSPDAAISGGYAGIIVDLFAEGKVLPQLEEAAAWLDLYDKLMPNGRFMVNCGAGDELPATNAISVHEGLSMDGTWKLNATIRALCKAFPGQEYEHMEVTNTKPTRSVLFFLCISGKLEKDARECRRKLSCSDWSFARFAHLVCCFS
ncbi:hypothetical protein CDL12_07289 [Handroanthus impetiginosus]|uniref:Spermidine synthase n=1 Tax=Handroanthus impetiginosus TaxID=429701 RepID=A0A2G9HR85_9LAMI|nr:hypothetical protein CDL12_07289 [Handroanthus impetiginosus]